MRVAVNALHLVPRETGGLEIYARRLLAALAPRVELVVYGSREGAPALAAEPWAADVVELPFSARSRAARVAAEQTLLPRALRRARADLLHNLFNTAPALPGVAQVTTIHDLIYRREPSSGSLAMRLGQGLLVPLAARRSRRIVTVSQASKADIVRWLGVDPARIDVAPNGPGIESPAPAGEVRERLGLGERPFVLTVAGGLPHKNLPRLIDAVALVNPRPLLVVAGYGGGAGSDDVRFPGWVDEPTLEGLYAEAAAFVFPSLAEGFGMPVLEAMRRGVPVACSDATSLPEVAGEAALLFDPRDTRSIAAAVERLLGDADLRARLAAAGRERARRFSWERAAAETLASYARATH